MSKPTYKRIALSMDKIEAEMKTVGLWSSAALPEEVYQFKQAFAMDTMAFTQWLQFIFIPVVRNLVKERGELPAESMVAVQAAREFDGNPQAGHLVALLSEFDALFEKG